MKLEETIAMVTGWLGELEPTPLARHIADAVLQHLASQRPEQGQPEPWGVQHLDGLRDGTIRVCINAKHGDSSDCGRCVVCQRDQVRAQAAEQGAMTQEQCALYLDMLASNHPHLAEAYRHAAHNLRAQTAETLALLTPPSRTP